MGNTSECYAVFLTLTIAMSCLTLLMVKPANAEATTDSWPMFRGNAAHSGYSPDAGPTTNNTLWFIDRTNVDAGGFTSSPTVVNNVVYVGGAEGFDGYLYAFDASTTQQIWKFKADERVVSSPSVVNGLVYMMTDAGNIYAIGAKNGSLTWSYKTQWNSSACSSRASPMVANGLLYESGLDGRIYCLNANTGELVWEYNTGYYVDSVPACCNGFVYVGGGDGNIYCFKATTGEKVWAFQTTDWVRSSPCISEGVVYASSIGGNVYALDTNTGRMIWNQTVGLVVNSSPAIAKGVLYVGGEDGYHFPLDDGGERWVYQNGTVTALNASTGLIIWKFSILNSQIDIDSVLATDNVIYAPGFGFLYALNASNGALLWDYSTDGPVTPPAIANGVLLAGSYAGLFAFDSNAPLPVDSNAPSCTPANTAPSALSTSLIIPLSIAGAITIAAAIVAIIYFSRHAKKEQL